MRRLRAPLQESVIDGLADPVAPAGEVRPSEAGTRQPGAGDYEPGLDGLRGFALLSVLLIHACTTSRLPDWFVGGSLGVSVFFTLSGYLITTNLLRDLDGHGSVDLSRFWGRRIRRLAPAALTTTLAVIIFAELGWLLTYRGDVIASVWSATNWRMVLATQPPWWRTGVGPFGPTWSLAIEEQFYVVLAVVAAIVARTRRPARNLAIVFAAITVVSLVLSNFVFDWMPHLYFGTDVRAAEPAVGCLLAVAVRRWRPLLAGRRRQLDVLASIAVAVLVVLIMTVGLKPAWLLRGGLVGVSVITSVVIVGILAHGALERAFAWRPMIAMGKVSYSAYVVHFPLMLMITPTLVGLETWSLVAGKLAATFLVATALYFGIEQPIRRRTDLSTRTTVIWWLAVSVAVTVLAILVTPY